MKMFPVLGTNYTVPYDLVERHKDQVWNNHHQTVEKIMSRGGLSWEELYCVLNDQSFNNHIPQQLAETYVRNVIEFNKNKINTLQLRPCEIKINKKDSVPVKKAYFHRWIDSVNFLYNETKTSFEKLNCTLALVEYEDGTMGECSIRDIKFTDRSEY